MEEYVNCTQRIGWDGLTKISLAVILEGQHPSGAFPAAPTFSQYNYCWLRDGTYIALSLLRRGYVEEVRSYIQWAADVIGRYTWKVEQLPTLLRSGNRQSTKWFLGARYTLEGEEDGSDWPNFQIDGYGSWLWLVAQFLQTTGQKAPDDWHERFITVVDYLDLVWKLPNSDCWEEFEGQVHPATLACLVGGLRDIAPYLDADYSLRCTSLAEEISAFVIEHIHPDGYFPKFLGSELVDASLIWLGVPYRVVELDDPALRRTIERIETELASGGGVKRYVKDTYYGGGEWVILAAFLGLYQLRVGNRTRAVQLLEWITEQQTNGGFLPEQVLHSVNVPSMIGVWEQKWGGVATPLIWSHAMFLLLEGELKGTTN